MLGKKPAPPPVSSSRPVAGQPAPSAVAVPGGWLMQILTNEYVVAGYFQPIDTPLVGWLNAPTQATITLSKAQVTALDPHTPQTPEIQSEVTVPKSAIIGLVPRDEKASGRSPPKCCRARSKPSSTPAHL